MGDPGATVVPGVASEFFRHFVSQAPRRENAKLFALSSEAVIERVRVNTYPTETEWRAGRANEEEERLYWHNVLCPGGGEPFDGEFLVVVTAGAQQRLVRKETQWSPHQDVTLAAGTCERILADFVEWYERLRSSDAG